MKIYSFVLILLFVLSCVSFNISAQLVIPKVTISSNVSKARIIIDGQEEGLTPLTLSLRPGNYNIQIIAEGLSSVTQPITVTSSGIQSFEINIPAGRRTKTSTIHVLRRVDVEVNVEGAFVKLGDIEVGQSPFHTNIVPGTYPLQITAPGYQSLTTMLIIPDVSNPKFTFELIPHYIKVHITVNVEGAFVKLGDIEVGQSPFHINIIPGTYPLQITAPGYQSLTTMLIIPDVSNPKFAFKLIPHYIKVNITVNVEGAFVKLGDIEVGQSPFHTNIIPGTYPLQVTAPGYQSLTTMLKITTDSTQNYGFTLVPKFGYLNIDLRLFGDTLESRRRVEFYVDGVRQTQLNNIKVIPGQRNLTLVTGMFRVARSVKIQPGNFYTIKLVANLDISSSDEINSTYIY